ncbi:MAG: hypothetical protein JJU01_01950 [Alkalibacterium sp.]|nr:hypothetical protein [Alkalibacterium sp.]
MQWLQKMLFYMNGRYGYDEFSKFLIILGLIFGIISNFAGGLWVSAIGIAIIAFGVLRIVSKEKNNRYKELTKYLAIKHKIQHVYRRYNNRWVQRKAYKFVKCPNCKQKLRIPRGKKKLKVTCPSCKQSFIRKS